MKCFTCCFRTNSNHKKIITKKSCSNKINSISPQALQDLLETREKGEDIVAINGTKEEVNHHDKIVKSINLIEESKDIISRENLLEFDENGEAYVDAIDAKKEARHKIVNSINLFEESKVEEEEEESNKNSKNDEGLLSNQVSANCSQNSNDEFEDIDLEDEANNNGDGNESNREESSYESLFSLSIDNSTRNGNNPIPEIMCDKEEVNNTSITTPPSLLNQQEEKENIDMNLLDFSTTRNRAKEEPNLKRGENDASLSSWLVECSQDDTPNSKNSVGSVGNSPSERCVGLIDRPILGALIVEELKDEKPIVIGTIGSYLRHTGQATGVSSY
uniref:Uncharacterized protein n=1 Tax=Solanum lycopersicum TaxID=4081 RepID=A0A3Q7FHZ2_SOLLC